MCDVCREGEAVSICKICGWSMCDQCGKIRGTICCCCFMQAMGMEDNFYARCLKEIWPGFTREEMKALDAMTQNVHVRHNYFSGGTVSFGRLEAMDSEAVASKRRAHQTVSMRAARTVAAKLGLRVRGGIPSFVD